MMLVEDFTTAAWWKLCINSVGALNGLTLKPVSVLWGEAMSRVALEMVAECVAVGRAEGAHLDDTMPEQVMAMYRAQPADSVIRCLRTGWPDGRRKRTRATARCAQGRKARDCNADEPDGAGAAAGHVEEA